MKVVLLEPLGVPEETVGRLAGELTDRGHTFKAYDSVSTDPEELKKRADGADVLMIANHPLPGSVIQSDPALKFISVAFVGIDHVDTEACKAQGIRISNTGGYCTDAVAELALGLTLDCLRRISAGNTAVQQGKSKAGLQGFELAGKTVGIIGTGAIGIRTAELFKAFHCQLIGYSKTERPEAKQLGLVYKSLSEVMAEADIISVHTPLTPDTKGLIGKEQIGLMRKHLPRHSARERSGPERTYLRRIRRFRKDIRCSARRISSAHRTSVLTRRNPSSAVRRWHLKMSQHGWTANRSA